MRGLLQRERLFFQARTNAELLRVTLNSIGDAVLATDANATITFLNPIAENLTGWKESDALGTPAAGVFRIVNETSRAKVENPLEKALSTGGIVGLANHTLLIAKDGREIPIDDSGAPIRDEDGHVIGAVLVFLDISQRRAAENRLKESNEQLKEFVAGAAHDLRSPLTSVSNIAQLVALRFRGQVGEEGLEMLGFIIAGVRRMTKLLDDLLTYAHASHFDRQSSQSVQAGPALRIVMDNLRSELEMNQATLDANALPPVAVQRVRRLSTDTAAGSGWNRRPAKGRFFASCCRRWNPPRRLQHSRRLMPWAATRFASVGMRCQSEV